MWCQISSIIASLASRLNLMSGVYRFGLWCMCNFLGGLDHWDTKRLLFVPSQISSSKFVYPLELKDEEKREQWSDKKK